jgi:hypothetical protein
VVRDHRDGASRLAPRGFAINLDELRQRCRFLISPAVEAWYVAINPHHAKGLVVVRLQQDTRRTCIGLNHDELWSGRDPRSHIPSHAPGVQGLLTISEENFNLVDTERLAIEHHAESTRLDPQAAFAGRQFLLTDPFRFRDRSQFNAIKIDRDVVGSAGCDSPLLDSERRTPLEVCGSSRSRDFLDPEPGESESRGSQYDTPGGREISDDFRLMRDRANLLANNEG